MFADYPRAVGGVHRAPLLPARAVCQTGAMASSDRCSYAALALVAALTLTSLVPARASAGPIAERRSAALDPYLQPVPLPPDYDFRAMERRQRMLRWHEGLSILTILTLGAQVAVGQAVMAAEEQRPITTSMARMRDAHLGLGAATAGVYLTSAALAIAAPPITRGPGYDAFTWHKGLTLLHGTGVVLVPLLGFAIEDARSTSRPDADRIRRLQTAQQAVGYTALGSLIGAAVVIAID